MSGVNGRTALVVVVLGAIVALISLVAAVLIFASGEGASTERLAILVGLIAPTITALVAAVVLVIRAAARDRPPRRHTDQPGTDHRSERIEPLPDGEARRDGPE